ncbi:MAG: hypothetical protein M1821_003128 [Bathelium mastoideum]|nr:MAG: hypothetical protein M1821_003128 [Bathelium mastoideum]
MATEESFARPGPGLPKSHNTNELAYFLRHTGPDLVQESQEPRLKKSSAFAQSTLSLIKRSYRQSALPTSRKSKSARDLSTAQVQQRTQRVSRNGKRYLAIEPSLPNPANGTWDFYKKPMNASELSFDLPETDIGLDDWVTHVSSQDRNQSTPTEQSTNIRATHTDTSEEKIIFGGTVTIETGSASSPDRTESVSTPGITGSSCSEGPKLYAPIPIRPLTSIQTQKLWQEGYEEKSPTYYTTAYSTTLMNRERTPAATGNRSPTKEPRTSHKAANREINPMSQRPIVPTRHPLRRATLQSSESPPLVSDRSLPSTCNNHVDKTPSLRSSREREQKIRCRKLRDLQHARQSIDKSSSQPCKSPKFMMSNYDKSSRFPTSPNVTAKRDIRPVLNTSLAGVRSIEKADKGVDHPSMAFTPAVGQLSLSPVMLVAEQSPTPTGRRTCKPTRLILPACKTAWKARSVAIRPEDSRSYEHGFSAHVARDPAYEFQDPKQNKKGSLQEIPAYASLQAQHISSNAISYQRDLPNALKPSNPSKAMQTHLDTENTHRTSLSSQSSASSTSSRPSNTPSLMNPVQPFPHDRTASFNDITTKLRARNVKLEAKIQALERQNRLFEAALMAVLKTDDTVYNCPCGSTFVSNRSGSEERNPKAQSRGEKKEGKGGESGSQEKIKNKYGKCESGASLRH